MPSFLIAEDHSVVRMGTVLMIMDVYPDALITEADTFDKALMQIKEQPFDVLLLDINLPGGGDLQMVEAVKLRQPEISILMFSSYEEELYALRFIDAGADGYLSKNAPAEEIKSAIRKVMRKEKYLSRKVQELLLEQRLNKGNNADTLSNREIEVMHLLAKGASVAEIKSIFNIRDSTVSTYKASIFRKMGVSNVIDLANKIRITQ